MDGAELIVALRRLSQQGTQYRRTVCRFAADALEQAMKELKEADLGCAFCANKENFEYCEECDYSCSNCKRECVCGDCFNNSSWKWQWNKEGKHEKEISNE